MLLLLLIYADIAWAQKGINPVDVADASFKFTKLASAGDESFLSWGFIELLADQMKRTKNARRMHMVFHVQNGAVEVKIHENVFTVHRGGVFQVPRGKLSFPLSLQVLLANLHNSHPSTIFPLPPQTQNIRFQLAFSSLYDRSHFMLIPWSDNGFRGTACLDDHRVFALRDVARSQTRTSEVKCGWCRSLLHCMPRMLCNQWPCRPTFRVVRAATACTYHHTLWLCFFAASLFRSGVVYDDMSFPRSRYVSP